MEGLGNKLKQARKNAGYGQKDVEALTGINYKTLSNYENDRSEPDVKKLALLCKVYGVSADYFITVDTDIIESKACIEDERTQEHIKKYQSLNETGKDQVDSYTDNIMANPANLVSPPEPITYTTAASGGEPGLRSGTISVSQEELDKQWREAQMAQDLEDWG